MMQRLRLVLLLGGLGLALAGNPASAAAAIPQDIVATGKLADLRWPEWPDYQPGVQSFYEAGNWAPAWSQDGRPSARALELIAVLKNASAKGLEPEDYDASRWDERLRRLGEPGMAARFDVALTVCVMRYVSDLHVGRVNPEHFKFKLAVRSSSFDLPQFLRQVLLTGPDLATNLELVEPPYVRYRLTRDALAGYLELERKGDGEPLPVPAKTVDAGGQYGGVPQLAQRLRLLGDLPADAVLPASAGGGEGEAYAEPLVAAVRHFQDRHGLTPDGRLGAQTVKAINVPLHQRVEQLELTLERWRWLPHEFPQPPVVVNIPEFRLRAFDEKLQLVLEMNVIVGKALRHETPVFAKDMRYVVFRPYWNVPPSIQRSEIVPAIARDRGYVARKGYEVTTQGGELVTDGTISDEVLAQLRSGRLAVRQKPGPDNALGLVKLIFPNEFNVYLHSTPSQQLFARSRRDFSHGCIRVEKPAELAAWALRRSAGWDLERVRATMQGDKDNVQVNLATPIPVLILYGTAVPGEDGSVHFYEDIYGHDAQLRKALAQGHPYNR